MLAALRLHGAEGLDLVVTSGGLGPTADDLTAEVVADFAGRPLALDDALEERIWTILERLRSRWRNLDEDAIRASQPQAGARARGRDGARAGRHRARPRRAAARPTVLVLPGPAARAAADVGDGAARPSRCATLLARAGTYEQRIMRLFGIPESEIARSLREIEADGVPIDRLEITTCLRRGEIEIATVFEPPRRRGLRRVRGGDPRAPRATRCSPTTARPSTTR